MRNSSCSHQRTLFQTNDFENLHYRRGYLVTDKNISVDSNDLGLVGWNKLITENFEINYCQKLELTSKFIGRWRVTLLGFALNPFTGENNNQAITRQLASKLNICRNSFYEYLDELTGRFILVCESDLEKFVLNDATGNRVIFYDNVQKAAAISSHAPIIAELFRYDVDTLAVEISNHPNYHMGGMSLPGVMSPYKSIKMLSANTLFNLESFVVERFFPRSEITAKPLDDAFLTYPISILKRQMDMLYDRFSIALSLTGGFDSRLSLSLSKGHLDEIATYTYVIWGSKGHRIDSLIASDLSQEFGFNHEIIRLSKADEFDSVTKAIRKNHGGIKRSPSLHSANYRYFPENYVEMRNVCSDIFRAHWQRNPANRSGKMTFQKLCNLHKRGTAEISVGAWEEYLEVTGFSMETSHGYDPYDLLYWERQMSFWLGLGLSDADISHETIVIYNNRKLQSYLLSTDLNERIEDNIVKRIMDMQMPELNKFPFNPKEYSPKYSMN